MILKGVAADIVCALHAGTRVIVLQTPDEVRALELLEQVAEERSCPLRTWSSASGIDAQGTPQPLEPLLRDHRHGETLWALLDPASALAVPSTARMLREVAQQVRGAPFVIVTPEPPSWTIPPEALTLDLPPPSAPMLEEHFRRLSETAEFEEQRSAMLFESAYGLARAALGLELFAVDQLLASALFEVGDDIPAITAYMRNNKASRVHTAGLLEPAQARPPQELAGASAYAQWVAQRTLALSPQAATYGIDPPRGALLIGVQGCGKSLAARTTATALDLPLFRLEPGRLFGGTVGRSEANLRRVLAALDAMAPVCLWIDEIDKGLAGSLGARSDGGTSSRVVGGLLTWLSEHTRPVFVIATANDVQGLPPELLRRGRLDEIFFFDLPQAEAREEILRVHLETVPQRRLGYVPAMADPWPAFAQIARDARGFSGAEIEAALTQARLFAFAQQRPLTSADLRTAIEDTVPLSVTRRESIDALRAWAEHRTRSAHA